MDPDRHIAELETQLGAIGEVRTHARGTVEFHLGMARAEHPGADDVAHRRAIGHYAEALRVFNAERFPLERARTYVALGVSERALGMATIAGERFETARQLLGDDAGPDLGAAENNLGLALEDQGDLPGAVAAFRRAVAVFAELAADRQEASAQQNLGRALAATGDSDAAERALRRGLLLTSPVEDGPLWASHAHALAVHLVAGGGTSAIREAIDLLESSLTVFTRAQHPFQHAMAKYNLGLARVAHADTAADSTIQLRLALAAFEDAVAMFDPRLHRAEWNAANRGIIEVEDRLDGGDRVRGFVALLTALPPEDRAKALFERLGRLWEAPEPARTALLRNLDRALVAVQGDVHDELARQWMRFLTEHSFENASDALTLRMEVIGGLEDADRSRAVAGIEAAVAELEVIIRTQVRSLLEAAGYRRPDGVR